ncbi:hypothetical protein [Scytonema sp. NUACC26]|uniref:hypothetical protein n=1 Tax=Scytonema sp. NUACC26 TaxID=3140176 RepID=UPI0034DBB29B
MAQTESNQVQELKEWQPYNLDHYAQKLVSDFRDKKNVLNESHKMRMAVAYGLERFWGEHLRFERDSKQESKEKGEYWKKVWDTLANDILKPTGIQLPNEKVRFDETDKIQKMTERIWEMTLEDRTIVLMVLTKFCDSLVWWTQRYKKKDEN